MKLSLKQAAEETGRSKSTIFRACKNGRISYDRGDAGSIWIDPAELFRVFEPAAGQATPETSQAKGGTTVSLQMEQLLEAQITALKELLGEKDRVISDLRIDRDRWATQAERLALTGPKTGWWSRLLSKAS